jgi:hypothetical protein
VRQAKFYNEMSKISGSDAPSFSSNNRGAFILEGKAFETLRSKDTEILKKLLP